MNAKTGERPQLRLAKFETELGKRWERDHIGDDAYSPHPEIKAIASESRICFGISWYPDEAKADEVGKWVRDKGHTYNGGWYHGMACGRDPSWDFRTEDGREFYAVTH